MKRRVPHHFLQLPAYTASLALFALMVLTFSDVLLRSVFNAPIEIAADLTRLLMAITVFSVMPIISSQGKQICVDLMDGFFTRFGWGRVREVIVNLFCGVILFWPAERVYVLAERARSYGDVMEYLGTPLHFIGWFIAAMTALTAVAFIGRGLVALFWPGLLKGQSA